MGFILQHINKKSTFETMNGPGSYSKGTVLEPGENGHSKSGEKGHFEVE